MRLGIIGNGASANSFAGAAWHVEGVELVGMAGRNLERVSVTAERHGTRAMSIDDLLQQDLDCIAVSTPPGLHGPHTLPFIRKGLHAMIDKPMALTVQDCDKLMAEAEAAGVKIMVTQTHRYNLHGQLARQVVQSGTYGQVVSIYAFLGHNYFGGKRVGWQLDHTLSGGGVTFNPFIHMIDYARWIAGSEVTRFHAHVGYHKPGYDIEGDVECMVEFENGAVAMVHVDGYGDHKDFRIDVIMEGAAMIVRPGEKRIDILKEGGVAEAIGIPYNAKKDEARGIYGHGGYMAHVIEMRDAIEKGGPITSDGANGRANVAIARELLERAGAPLPGPAI